MQIRLVYIIKYSLFSVQYKCALAINKGASVSTPSA